MPKISSDWSRRQNHSEIEKRRRDKMNMYILELSKIIPVGSSRKLDKLTVLRMAVHYIKALGGSVNACANDNYKPNCLSDLELKNLILSASDGFMFVVGCDRGKIMYVSESVSQTLQYTNNELLGTSWFDILHPKDLIKVKEQLSSTDISRRDRLVDAKTLLPVKADLPQGLFKLSPGLRRSFFCRMRIQTGNEVKKGAEASSGRCKKKTKLQFDKKYVVIHFTGYLKSWPISTEGAEEAENEGDSDASNLLCLVAVGRMHQPLLSYVPQHALGLSNILPNQPVEYISKHTSDGKFVFLNQEVTLLLGWLPQELLGSSMYEYFHPNDISHISEVHRVVLQSNESRNTQVYRFRSKDGSFLHFRSVWNTFKNPWTKDVEYIISNNFLITCEEVDQGATALECGASQSHSNLNELMSSPCGSNSSVASSVMAVSETRAGNIGVIIAEEASESQCQRPSSATQSFTSHKDMPVFAAQDTSSSVFMKIEDDDQTTTSNSCIMSRMMSLDSDNVSEPNESVYQGLTQIDSTNNDFHMIAASSQAEPTNVDVIEGAEASRGESGRRESDDTVMSIFRSLFEGNGEMGGLVDFNSMT